MIPNFLPQFFPRHWLEDAPDIVHSEFPSRICVGYVVRGEGSYSYLMRDEFESLNLDLEQLHEIAVRNLAAMPFPNLTVAKTPEGPEAWLSDSVDNFTASRLLLPKVRTVFATTLGSEYFSAIPSRDWIVCWSKNQRADFQAKNEREAREIFLSDDYNLTPDVFLVAESGFRLHKEQSVDA